MDYDREEVETLSPIKSEKMFNDPIHGNIALPDLCVRIIDTPQFQRLRNIKQLGGCYFVYPGASHNRFEHSIGVCHLAGKMVKIIRAKQPELDINDEDVLCVQVAGLCHDLGHGPFSHLFDGLFIPAVNPTSKWKHEKASIDMFDHMIETNNIDLNKYKLDKDKDSKFIKELIYGPYGEDEKQSLETFEKLVAENGIDKDKYMLDEEKDLNFLKELFLKENERRRNGKEFLYQIVANKDTGIDVDKWDYFARDSHHLGFASMFNHSRMMEMCRVIKDPYDGDKYKICVRDKERFNVYDMFHTRYVLHTRAYQHKTNKCIEVMIADAFIAAEAAGFTVNQSGIKMSACIEYKNMNVYTHLNDGVYSDILSSPDKAMEEARHILERIEKRELYRIIGQAKLKRGKYYDKREIKHMELEIGVGYTKSGHNLDKKDITVVGITYDYGMNENDPVEKLRFYSKDEPDVPKPVSKEQVSRLLPAEFRDQILTGYFKVQKDQDPGDQKMDQAKKCFENYCKKYVSILEQIF